MKDDKQKIAGVCNSLTTQNKKVWAAKQIIGAMARVRAIGHLISIPGRWSSVLRRTAIYQTEAQ